MRQAPYAYQKVSEIMRVITAIFIIASLISCNKKEKQKEVRYPVATAKAKKMDSPIFIENIGHVKAINSVEIRSRVEGELLKVHFKEGDEVLENAPLFTIDPREYEVEIEKNQAVLEENLANLYIAKDKVIRYKNLVEKEYISELNFEELQTDVCKLEAIIKQNEADIEDAKLNLSYCYITSPINGKTGIVQIKRGNLIEKNSETPITTINQISPIHVLFSAPEKELDRIFYHFRKGKLKTIATFNEKKLSGTLEFVDNEVDRSTGMITLRSIFENRDKVLWPGKFVKVRLILYIEKDAIIIPFQAVQITTKGPCVFVVKDERVELREVVLGQREDENIIIKKGVEEGETVVTKGQLNLSDKSLVLIKND